MYDIKLCIVVRNKSNKGKHGDILMEKKTYAQIYNFCLSMEQITFSLKFSCSHNDVIIQEMKKASDYC